MKWLRPIEVAEKFDMPLSTVHYLIRRGEIPAVRLGRRWMIPEDRLLEMLDQQLEERAAARAERRAAAHRSRRLQG